MKITSLSLFNLRSFEFAEFTFNPQFNLIAGINGAGKSTVLDAIRTCASHVLPAMIRVPSKPFSFSFDDIRDDAPFADATVHFTLGGEPCRFTLREWREPLAFDNPANLEKLRREILDAERLNERPRKLIRDLAETLDTPSPTVFNPPETQLKSLATNEKSAPLAMFFSTSRSRVNGLASKAAALKGTGGAYRNALRSTRLSIVETADRLRVQRELATEHEPSRRAVELLDEAVATFLPGFSNLRPSDEGRSRILIDYNGTTLNLRQLSDGERSVLVLILDIARRLTQANPNLKDPMQEGEAIILIDEIDLHLHPQWQRKIVGDLTRTFPNCQFIATTHSPFIIQSLQPGDLINLGPEEFAEYSDQSIEDISENVMGVELPQKSKRYQEMMKAAEEYFTLVRQPEPNQELIAMAEDRLNELSIPFSDDPAFQALLKLERKTNEHGDSDASS